MEDPRDSHYYNLQKKDLSQLTSQEIKDYNSYCEKMIAYVGSTKKARKGWVKLKNDLKALTV